MEAPHRAYYRSMHGRWEGELRVAVTDPEALRAAPIGWLDRLRINGLRAFATLTMRTSLDFLPDERAADPVHTTRVSKGGIPLQSSVERFALQPDGRSAVLTAQVWAPPLPWPIGDFGPDARVVVDEDARGATYHLRVLGGPVVQRTRIASDDALEIEQDFGWGRAEVLLRRVARAV